jgi:hypothetical protein
MTAWLAENSGRVVVKTTESFASSPQRTWFLFEVIGNPTNFPFTTLGFPTIAALNVQHSDDTVQKPPPETGPDITILGLTLTPTILILAGVAVFALSQTSRRR